MKVKNRFPFTLSKKQAKKIIAIACSEWKPKLAEQWAEKIVLEKDIIIKESYYKIMRKACTTSQHELFDEIFGKDQKPKGWFWANETAQAEKSFLYYLDGEEGRSYGFCWSGDWSDRLHVGNDESSKIKATNQEVEKALSKEAEKRGFIIGSRYDSLTETNARYEEKNTRVDRLICETQEVRTTKGCIYHKGRWATVNKETFKVGDWIVWENNTDLQIIKIEEIKYDGWVCSSMFRSPYLDDGDFNSHNPRYITRLATKEEITKASIIDKDVACLVRDYEDNPWELAYSDGKGEFTSFKNEESSEAVGWEQVKVLTNQQGLPES